MPTGPTLLAFIVFTWLARLATFLKVIIAGGSLTHVTDRLLVHVEKQFNLLRFVASFCLELVICHTLTNFVHTVDIQVIISAIATVDLDHSIH